MAGVSTTTTPTESDIYDRQIRLWGADAQQKLSSAKVLFLNVTGVTLEVLKNLTLAGVSPCFCDDRPFPDALEEVPTSFFATSDRHKNAKKQRTDNDTADAAPSEAPATVAHALKQKVLELNSLLLPDSIDILPPGSAESEDDALWAPFLVVVASARTLGPASVTRIARAVTSRGGKFYLVDTFGLWGCAISDLSSSHSFRAEMGKDKWSDLKSLQPYSALDEVLQSSLQHSMVGRWDKKAPPLLWALYKSYLEYQRVTDKWPTPTVADDYLARTKEWLTQESTKATAAGKPSIDHESLFGTLPGGLEQCAKVACADVMPVCSILGGVLGNEIIKAISGKGEPTNNVLLFDGTVGSLRSIVVENK